MTDKLTELECPTCSTTVTWSEDFPFRPFCSKRCQLVDFGEWANENHRIKGPSSIDEALELNDEFLGLDDDEN